VFSIIFVELINIKDEKNTFKSAYFSWNVSSE
jgi:hypothetical protein